MKAFDCEKYKELQKKEIFNRISQYGKLYFEVGGKLFDDNHASRVLPGFENDVKMQIFSELKNQLEVIFCVNTQNIINGKIRDDNKLNYGDETIRLVQKMQDLGISTLGIMINFYEPHELVLNFENKCNQLHIKTYHSYYIDNYPNDINHILSRDGYGKNDYIKTTKNLILVSAPGANSGKLQTCLSQLYNDRKNGIKAGYSKYETFPVWNLPLDHMVNIAYEMATVDLKDQNVIDPYYLESTGKTAVNYNRDVEAFPIVNKILTKIMGHAIYDSPTSMGVNNVGNAIVDDYLVQMASLKEIESRHEKHTLMFKEGKLSLSSFERSKLLLKKAQDIFKKLKQI